MSIGKVALGRAVAAAGGPAANKLLRLRPAPAGITQPARFNAWST